MQRATALQVQRYDALARDATQEVDVTTAGAIGGCTVVLRFVDIPAAVGSNSRVDLCES